MNNTVYKILFILLLLLIICFYLSRKSNIEKFSSKSKFGGSKSIADTFVKRKEFEHKKILIKTKEVLDSLNIPFFLSSGTLLGYYRENKFLDHDYDVDIGIYASDYTPEIKTKMNEAGFYNYRNLGEPETGYEMSFYLRNSPLNQIAKIDIFLHYDELKDGINYLYWTSYEIPKLVKKIKYRVPYFTIVETDFYGIKVNIPSDTLNYIENHYGMDWRTPKYLGKTYDYRSSPVSIVRD